MSRELALSPSVIASMQEYLSPDYTAKRQAIANWKEVLLYCYFFLIAAAFIAREGRNLLENSMRQLITVSYPGRSVRVPRGGGLFLKPVAASTFLMLRCAAAERDARLAEFASPPAKNSALPPRPTNRQHWTALPLRATCGSPVNCVHKEKISVFPCCYRAATLPTSDAAT